MDDDWAVDPFGGEVRDGYVWGRGAVDMKGMVAAVLAALRAMRSAGVLPRRDLVLAFFADEEAGGRLGACHVTRSRPDLFAGCREAIGEVGGFSYSVTPDHRAYLVSAAEKGVLWADLAASGTAGHGSMINADNAVTHVARAVTRLADQVHEPRLTPTVMGFFVALRQLLARPEADEETLLEQIGPLARMIRASMSDTVNPTMLQAGYKSNVIPSRAQATIDGRFLPGNGEAFKRSVADVAGDDVRMQEIFFGDAVEATWQTPLVAAMEASLQSWDPGAVILPYMSTAFTDAKWLAQLGIQCYGFCPLLLPDDLDFTALFHGVDERVPIEGLEFSASVLRHLFETY